MQLDDPRAQRADPILRVTVDSDVADVEVGADVRAVEFVDVTREFERTLQKFIPHFLDGDDDTQFLRQRDQSPNGPLGSLPGLRVADVSGDHRGDQKNRRRAPKLGIAEAGTHAVEALLDHRRIG